MLVELCSLIPGAQESSKPSLENREARNWLGTISPVEAEPLDRFHFDQQDRETEFAPTVQRKEQQRRFRDKAQSLIALSRKRR